MLDVQLVHPLLVDPDEDHIDDERTLRSHVERERPAEEVDLRELGGEEAHRERHQEPDREKDDGEPEVLLPVMDVGLGQGHAALLGDAGGVVCMSRISVAAYRGSNLRRDWWIRRASALRPRWW